MATTVLEELKSLATVDLFTEARRQDGFVGRPFYLDFNTLRLLSNDSWKRKVGGVPAGAFLLCIYTAEEGVDEALLVRVLRPTRLPTDDDVVAAMIDHYKEQSAGSKLDSYTRAEFQYSGLECRVIGSFYRNGESKIRFAGDLDNFYAANSYEVIKPTGDLLKYIVNFREDGIPGGRGDERIGKIRYSSSQRHISGEDVPVYVTPIDFLGKRTALFGMTRTGKSNSVKKIIQATVGISRSGVLINGNAIKPVGQIIFDINGEYANANLQDDGTAIFQQYPDEVTRYSEIEKQGFEVMKVNFYREPENGLTLISDHFKSQIGGADYFSNFLSINLEKPEDYTSAFDSRYRYDMLKAAYLCCLYKAGFTVPSGFKVKFKGATEINAAVREVPIDPNIEGGISLDEATSWFEWVWDHYDDKDGYFDKYQKKNGKHWANEELRAVFPILTKKKSSNAAATMSGYVKLVPLKKLHTASSDASFTKTIVEKLRDGKIVIVDLSQGNPDIQRLYSERICQAIFASSMDNFVRGRENNYIQMYFEEAHNLFPKKDDKDLSQIYNRLAKEGAKLFIGLSYATQEVSSISSSILKNTQNWFVAHLNNQDELREINKYYDFEDFTDSLRRTTDKGFIRLKTDSNTFIVPIQVDQFKVAMREGGTPEAAKVEVV